MPVENPTLRQEVRDLESTITISHGGSKDITIAIDESAGSRTQAVPRPMKPWKR